MNQRKKILIIEKGDPDATHPAYKPSDENSPFNSALRGLGDLKIVRNGKDLSEQEIVSLIKACNIYVIRHNSMFITLPKTLASDRGDLEYICTTTGGVSNSIPIELIDAGLPVSNWGDGVGPGLAEGAMTLLLAVLHDLHARIILVREGGWRPDSSWPGGTMYGLNIGVYGFGYGGRYFSQLAKSFTGTIVRFFDPYAKDIPGSLIRVNSLDELFGQSQAIVIMAGLTDKTKHSVTAELLAKLPNGGIVINNARGAIIDQAAFFAELEKGRLRAGLDVLEPDNLMAGHPARQWKNCIFTGHYFPNFWNPPRLDPAENNCIENVRRFINGEPLRFVIDKTKYSLMT